MIAADLFVTPRNWPPVQAPSNLGQSGSLGTPAECARRVGLHFPGIWPRLDRLRAKYADGAHGFPDHWYLPFNGIVPVLDELLEEMAQAGARVGNVPGTTVNMLATLAGWRATQGVYRFDPSLYDALIATLIEGKLPTELLSRLPEWSVYIETPGMRWVGEPLYGVFAQVGDLHDGAQVLTLVAHTAGPDHAVSGVSIRLDEETIGVALDAVYFRQAEKGMVLDADELATLHAVPRVISLLLYLRSEAAGIGDGTRRPVRSVPRKTKKGTRMFPAQRPTSWDVGMRLGAALRRTWSDQDRAGQVPDSMNGSPRPHIRRAHWHTFLRGSRKNPKRVLRWLLPMPINVDVSDDLVPTVRPVVAALPATRSSLPKTKL